MINTFETWLTKHASLLWLFGVMVVWVGMGSGCGGAMPRSDGREVVPLDPTAARAQVEAERGRIQSLQRGSERHTTPHNVEGPPNMAGDRVAGPCEEPCRAAEGICTSSERICIISAAHPREQDFQEACVWASGECASARQVCRSCDAL